MWAVQGLSPWTFCLQDDKRRRQRGRAQNLYGGQTVRTQNIQINWGKVIDLTD